MHPQPSASVWSLRATQRPRPSKRYPKSLLRSRGPAGPAHWPGPPAAGSKTGRLRPSGDRGSGSSRLAVQHLVPQWTCPGSSLRSRRQAAPTSPRQRACLRVGGNRSRARLLAPRLSGPSKPPLRCRPADLATRRHIDGRRPEQRRRVESRAGLAGAVASAQSRLERAPLPPAPFRPAPAQSMPPGRPVVAALRRIPSLTRCST